MAAVARLAVLALATACCSAALAWAGPAGAADEELMPLKLKLPKPVFPGTPKDVPAGHDVEITKGPRVMPKVPKNVTNLALNKKVTSSAKVTFTGELTQIVDGEKEAREDTTVEVKPRLQWVQIDLGQPATLWAIILWHWHMEPVIFRDVVVHASDDPDFIEGVTTLFNNDQDNSSGLGIGRNREYFETFEGKLIEGEKTKARYVRFYSNGSTHRDQLNRYTEIEIYGVAGQ